jgi:hypothetical protein
MTSQQQEPATLTLVEFLLARIAEDEQRADQLHDEDCDGVSPPPGPFPCDCGFPARVRAECEAKRRIVELAAGQEEDVSRPGGVAALDAVLLEVGGLPGWTENEIRTEYLGPALDVAYPIIAAAVLDPVLRALALPYASHPDYRDEWRP